MKWGGLLIQTHEDVYKPSDDSFLLAEVVTAHCGPGIRFLEVGTGSGVVALTAAQAGATAHAIDLNSHAAQLASQNATANGLELRVILGDLLAPLRGAFDVVAFNPPYLPTAPDEVIPGPLNHAFDGGPDGNKVVLAFAQQLAQLESLPGCVLVIHSSLSDPSALDRAMHELGFDQDIAASQKLPYEVLTVRRYRLESV